MGIALRANAIPDGLPSGLNATPPILRLRYQGSADRWAIGIYQTSSCRYSESELPGSFVPATGTPEQVIDDTFILYAGPQNRKLLALTVTPGISADGKNAKFEIQASKS